MTLWNSAVVLKYKISFEPYSNFFSNHSSPFRPPLQPVWIRKEDKNSPPEWDLGQSALLT